MQGLVERYVNSTEQGSQAADHVAKEKQVLVRDPYDFKIFLNCHAGPDIRRTYGYPKKKILQTSGLGQTSITLF